MNFLKTPKSAYTDFYDQARFELTWKTSVFFTILLPILIVVFVFIEQTTVLPTTIGWLLCFVFLVTLKRSKKFKVTAIFFSLAGSVLCVATLVSIADGYHFADTLWMMIITLFAFFTLEKKWGIITGSINLAGILYFIVFLSEKNIQGILDKGFNLDQRIALAANIFIASSMICYLILQFVKTRKFAEENYRNANNSLEAQNKVISAKNLEKTVMLKEIHHRVKNNLQVISSLLRLQSSKTSDSASKVSYQDTINRVSTMALIHEKMYQNEDISNIDLKEYIDGLLNEILKSYSINIPVKYTIDSDIEKLEIKTLVPFALIINELVTNSLKHAYTEQSSGKIEIEIKDLKDEYFSLSYCDSGIWKDSENTAHSFGLELIEILTEQLEGRFSKSTTPQTHWKFELKNMA